MNLIGRCTAEGVKLVRYADDIVVFAKSKRAAERLLESCRKYLEGRLKLKMNTEKSKATSIFAQKNFKFLGFCLGKNGRGIFIRVHRKSLDKAKKTLKQAEKRIAELIDKIIVHEPDKSSGKRVQDIEIHFRFDVTVSTISVETGK